METRKIALNKYISFCRFNIVILLFYLPLTHLSAQNNFNIKDSLFQVLSAMPDNIEKVKKLDDIIWDLRNSKPDLAIQFSYQELKLAKELNYEPGIRDAYNRIGYLNQINESLDTAKFYYEKALLIEKKNNDTFGLARSFNNLAIIYKKKETYEKAIKYFLKAYNSFKLLKRKPQIALVANHLGSCYQRIGDNNIAIEYLQSSEQIYETLGNRNGLAQVQIELGNYYLTNRNYQEASYYFLKAKEYFQTTNDKLSLSQIYNNLGNIYKNLLEYDKANKYYHISLQLKKDNKIESGLTKTLNNLGQIAIFQGDTSKARIYFEQSLEIASFNNDSSAISDVYNDMALLAKAKGNYETAISLCNKSLTLNKLFKNKYQELKVLKNLSLLYIDIGDRKNYLKYEKQYSQLRDSLEQNYRSSIKLQDQLEDAAFLEKIKTAEAKYYQAQEAQQTTIIYALSIGIALLLGLTFAIYRALRSERKEVKTRERALQAEKEILDKDLKIKDLLVEQELKSLSAMLEGQEKERNRIAKDLHDRLGGLLSTVKIHFQAVEKQITAIKLQNQEQYLKANQLLDDACAEVRKVALDLESGVLQQFGLIPALIDLKHTVEGGGILDINLVDVGFEEKRLDAKMEIEIYRVIQELLSNIMRHAEAKEVEISLFRQKDKNNLNIIVEDNGKGFDPEAPAYQPGMGLKNIHSRVEELNGDIQIDSEPGKGTTTIINIPLKP